MLVAVFWLHRNARCLSKVHTARAGEVGLSPLVWLSCWYAALLVFFFTCDILQAWLLQVRHDQCMIICKCSVEDEKKSWSSISS